METKTVNFAASVELAVVVVSFAASNASERVYLLGEHKESLFPRRHFAYARRRRNPTYDVHKLVGFCFVLVP